MALAVTDSMTTYKKSPKNIENGQTRSIFVLKLPKLRLFERSPIKFVFFRSSIEKVFK